MRLKYEKVIHHAIVNNLFGFGYTKKSCNAQGSSKYYLFVTASLLFTMFSVISIHNCNDSFTIDNTSIKDCFVSFIDRHLNDV